MKPYIRLFGATVPGLEAGLLEEPFARVLMSFLGQFVEAIFLLAAIDC
jgi:hypothetical protein